MSREWKTIRADAVQSGLLDDAQIAEHRRPMKQAVLAQRLFEMRKAQGETQVQLARLMKVSQSRVSKLERGEIASSEVATLRSYVEALGGTLRVTADFPDRSVELS